MTNLLLTGLDGTNPLGFLAAIGVLNVLADSAPEGADARLAWRYRGAWRPLVTLRDEPLTFELLAQRVVADLATWKKEPAIALEYDGVRDLKPPPPVYRGYLERLVEHSGPDRRRSVDVAAAFATDVAVDGSGNTKPTAFHFTSGQQKFLGMVRELVDGLTRNDVLEAIAGPWRYARSLPVLRWDSTVTREHALSAAAPADEKPTGVPGADWLAFRGLSLLPVAPRGRRVETAACFGNRSEKVFRWPLWSCPLSRASLRSTLCYAALNVATERERQARGVAVVLESKIRRSNKGYGNFSPASAV